MEQQLKQRLIGAVVLVSLAVIFIPVILEGPDDEWSPRDHRVPDAPHVDYRAAVDLPLPAVQSDETADVPDAMEQAAPPPVLDSGAAQAVSRQAKPTPEAQPVEQPAEQPAVAADQPPAGWYAQVGSFSQPANAAGMRDSVNSAGFHAHLQEVVSAKGTSYRVLAGPEPSREKAEQLLAKMGKTLNSSGIVIEIGAREK
jgi:DedD protein